MKKCGWFLVTMLLSCKLRKELQYEYVASCSGICNRSIIFVLKVNVIESQSENETVVVQTIVR